MEQFFKSSTFFNGTSVLLRRAAAPAHGFDARLKTVSDWLYFLETAKNGRVGYIPEVLARYRVHEGSVSQNTDVMLADFLVAIGIAESKFPELIRFGRRLRGEFMTACALQYLRAARYDKASEYLRLAMRLRPFGTSYTRFPLNVVLYVLARTNRLDLVDMLLRAQANARARLSTRS